MNKKEMAEMNMCKNKNFVIRLARDVLKKIILLASIMILLLLPIEIIGMYMVYNTLVSKILFNIFITAILSAFMTIIIISNKIIKKLETEIHDLTMYVTDPSGKHIKEKNVFQNIYPVSASTSSDIDDKIENKLNDN